MGCCMQKSTIYPLPPWARPGVRVVSQAAFTAGFESAVQLAFEASIEPGRRAVICRVDNHAVSVVGADPKYPTLVIRLSRQDFAQYWRKALPTEQGVQ